jgi:hypothetical protein
MRSLFQLRGRSADSAQRLWALNVKSRIHAGAHLIVVTADYTIAQKTLKKLQDPGVEHEARRWLDVDCWRAISRVARLNWRLGIAALHQFPVSLSCLAVTPDDAT